MILWVFNVGSTGLKWQVLSLPPASRHARGALKPFETVLASGRARRLNTHRPELTAQWGQGRWRRQLRQPLSLSEAIARFQDWLTRQALLDRIDACAFKTVHLQGAEDLPEAVLLDSTVLERMQIYSEVAPAHNPPYIEAIHAVQSIFDRPCIGAFETVFHQTISEADYLYAVPREWYLQYGIRRYGFHGASHRYIAERLAELMPKSPPRRAVSVHIGGSSSLCALLDGRSVQTTMGFSPQGAIPNATRCGECDPFIVFWLAEHVGFSLDEIRHALVSASGLQGLSGIPGGNFPAILREREGPPAVAFEHLVHQISQTIGAYAVRLGGLDAIAFTGGIGEHEPRLRQAVCDRLVWLGLQLEPEANQPVRGEQRLSTPDSRIAVYVIPTHEELIVGRRALTCLSTP